MEKGNKVTIKNTDTIWDGKHGTVIAEQDGQVEVRINFETEDGTKQVIEIFDEENLEMEREDESLNENVNEETSFLSNGIKCVGFIEEFDKEWLDYMTSFYSNWLSENEIVEARADDTVSEDTGGFLLIDKDGYELPAVSIYDVLYVEGNSVPDNASYNLRKEGLNEKNLSGEDALLFNIHNKQGAYIDPTGKSTVKDKRNQNLDKKQVIKDLHDFAGVKPEKPIEESLNYEKTDDIIHPYVYLQDLDDKEIPAWNFASRIATAENVEEGFILKCAEDHKYKIFSVEAPSFFRTIIAAKEIKLEEIQEEYADFLQGNAVIYEIK